MANIFDLFNQIAKKESAPAGAVEYIVVGLGNPGSEYENTRHNVGFMAIDTVAKKYGVRIDRTKFKALVGDCVIGGKRVLLLKPQTYMNLSGEAVVEAAKFYKIDAQHIIVLSDDTNLDAGRLRVRKKGSDGGHNGLKNICLHLSSQEYPRIRIGVGHKPHPDYDMADFVLGVPDRESLEKIRNTFDTVCTGIEKTVEGDIDGAMQICNSFKQE